VCEVESCTHAATLLVQKQGAPGRMLLCLRHYNILLGLIGYYDPGTNVEISGDVTKLEPPTLEERQRAADQQREYISMMSSTNTPAVELLERVVHWIWMTVFALVSALAGWKLADTLMYIAEVWSGAR
jgi:hypothetical protein